MSTPTPRYPTDTDSRGTIPVRPAAPLTTDRAGREEVRTWLTATVRPAGPLDGEGTRRLRALLDALAACASIVVLDLEAARLETRSAAGAIDAAAVALEARGGALVCVHADPSSRRVLSGAGHAVVVDA